MSAVSAGFASGWTRSPRLNTVAPSASFLRSVCVCFGCSFKASPPTELLSYVKLARMRGANLVTESPREDQDDRQGDHVHEL